MLFGLVTFVIYANCNIKIDLILMYSEGNCTWFG